MSQELFKQVQENLKKIRECSKHEFNIEERKPFAKLTCNNCGGTVDSSYVLHYIQGYKAAGGDPEDIVPGFGKDFK